MVFISSHYGTKLWTNHERRSAQARAFSENKEYVLPARIDNTEIPGLPPTVGYVDLRLVKPQKLAKMIIEKLGSRQRSHFLPPVLDRLNKRVGAISESDKDRVSNIASAFFDALERMSADERTVISTAFLHGCPAELPENVHINLDFLKRLTGFPPAKIKKLLAGVSSLGFRSTLRDDPDGEEKSLGRAIIVVIKFVALRSSVEPRDDETNVAVEMVVGATENFCEQCGVNALVRVDFSQLASATTEKERHKARRTKEWKKKLEDERRSSH